MKKVSAYVNELYWFLCLDWTVKAIPIRIYLYKRLARHFFWEKGLDHPDADSNVRLKKDYTSVVPLRTTKESDYT